MFNPAYTRQFNRDLRRLRRSGYDLSELKAVIARLLRGERLYNKNWIIPRHGYKTPAQVRQEHLQALPLAA